MKNKMIKETDNDRCYTVYMHTSPSGKRYIGITSTSVEERWRNGAAGGGGCLQISTFWRSGARFGDCVFHFFKV